MKQFILFILILFPLYSIRAQKQEVIAKFIITDASINGVNMSQLIVTEGGGYTVFYTVEGRNLLYMANVWSKQNTQSWGALYMEDVQSYPETVDQYKTEIFFFRWEYQNSYDTKKGTCSIQFIKTYKPQGVASTLKMITEELDVTIYKGYMEGTLDFSRFQ